VGPTYHKNRIITLSVLGGVIVTLLGLFLTGTLAVEAGKTSAMSSKRYSDQEIDDNNRFWDDEGRIDQAKPVGPQAAPDEAPSSPTFRPPRTVEAEEVAAPYDTPENAIRGKIFFEVPGGVAECSGTVVTHGSKNMVWTAAHCLHGGRDGDFYKRVTFVPGYDGNGATMAEKAPYGRWPARQVEVSDEWVKNADPERDSIASPFDFGAFTVEPPPGKSSLQDEIGAAADIMFNAPRNLTVHSYGYPGEQPFDGKVMYTCTSPTTDFRNTGWPEPAMLWMGCTMTAGSSGGGWFAEVDGRQYLVSNISLGITAAGTQTMTGPYLGNAAHELYDRF
jgi:V8-like Glu-specific endopeptidase